MPRVRELGTLIPGSHALDHDTILHRLLRKDIGEVAKGLSRMCRKGRAWSWS